MYKLILLGLILIPSIAFLIGLLWYRHPSEKLSYKSGYRTKKSMKNKATWKFAQRHQGKILMFFGLGLLLLNISVYLLFKENYLIVGLGLIIIDIAALSLSIIPTEKALEKNYDSQGRKINNK